jgi:hypothetical protein
MLSYTSLDADFGDRSLLEDMYLASEHGDSLTIPAGAKIDVVVGPAPSGTFLPTSMYLCGQSLPDFDEDADVYPDSVDLEFTDLLWLIEGVLKENVYVNNAARHTVAFCVMQTIYLNCTIRSSPRKPRWPARF